MVVLQSTFSEFPKFFLSSTIFLSPSQQAQFLVDTFQYAMLADGLNESHPIIQVSLMVTSSCWFQEYNIPVINTTHIHVYCITTRVCTCKLDYQSTISSYLIVTVKSVPYLCVHLLLYIPGRFTNIFSHTLVLL